MPGHLRSPGPYILDGGLRFGHAPAVTNTYAQARRSNGGDPAGSSGDH